MTHITRPGTPRDTDHRRLERSSDAGGGLRRFAALDSVLGLLSFGIVSGIVLGCAVWIAALLRAPLDATLTAASAPTVPALPPASLLFPVTGVARSQLRD